MLVNSHKNQLIAQYHYQNELYTFDLHQPIDLSLPIHTGDENPNCYYAENPVFQTIRSGDFIGSVAEGGSCNYQRITLTPHGNGTHTECYGHISADPEATIQNYLKDFFAVAQLISLTPTVVETDSVILFKDFKNKIHKPYPEAIVIRTLPNGKDKKNKKYSNTNPAYLDPEIGTFLAENNILHLLVDLPSVDKEIDGGVLETHKAFWQMSTQIDSQIRKNATITELIFVPDELEDGVYLLNLQIISLETDASPSKPVLYAVQ
jgi:arylformamidase